MIWESIKIVLKELRLNKMRTFLTMLGIIVGIFSITIIFALSTATKDFMNNALSSISTELTVFDIHDVNSIESDLIDKDLSEYYKTSSMVNKMGKATTFLYDEYDKILEVVNAQEEWSNPGLYMGVDENYFDLNSSIISAKNLIDGRLLSKKDIISRMPYIVLREDTAMNIFGRVNVVGEMVNINNSEFEVIGVLQYDENGLFSGEIANVYVSYYYAKSYMKTNGSIMYYFSAKKNEYTSDIKTQVKRILNEYISSDNYYIYSTDMDMLMGEVESIVGIIELVFTGIASLSILVGGIGIMNIMLVSVSERIKETGIRMVLGARSRDIIFQFLIEGIMLTLFSGIIGIVMAWLVTSGANTLIREYTTYDFVLSVDILTVIKIIVFCGVIGIVFGFYPAIKAGRLDPVEALKYE